MIPIKEVQHPGTGFLALVYPFDKERVLNALKDIGLEYEYESNEALQQYVNEYYMEDFVIKYRGTKFLADTINRCTIDSENKTMSFITKHGMLLLVASSVVSFAIENKLYLFSESSHYEIYFIPAANDTDAGNE